jgi:hypothetical protein
MKAPLGQHGRRLPRYRPQTESTLEIHDVEPEPQVNRSTAPGDSRKLRGIPAIGRGVAGAINGTTPHLTELPAKRHYRE